MKVHVRKSLLGDWIVYPAPAIGSPSWLRLASAHPTHAAAMEEALRVWERLNCQSAT